MPKELKYILPPSVTYLSQRKDTLEKRVSSWIQPWEGKKNADVALLGVPFSRASLSGVSGAGAAPNALRQTFLRNTTYSPDYDIDIQMLKAYDLGDVRQHVTDISGTHANIRETVIETYRELGEILLLNEGLGSKLHYTLCFTPPTISFILINSELNLLSPSLLFSTPLTALVTA